MILDGLNANQLQAVVTRSRSVLVLAGAGSGKTGVLTRRIGYLCEDRGVSAHNILALTFTRKAAKEMKERLTAMLGEKEAAKMWIGTFHGISLKILESFGSRIGYGKDITVYDEIDQKDIIASIISELGLGLKVEDAVAEMQGYASDCDRYEFDADFTLLITEYRNRLKEFNAVDFTLLLTEVLRLFREFPDVFQHFHDKFRYVFVDEYQDVDRTQYYLHEALKPENIFCVGDMNQTIYSWRGSDMKIILDFEKSHEGSEVIILDQSYRCGSSILEAANNLIGHNPKQYDIELWTERGPGEILSDVAADVDEEARLIVDQIKKEARFAGTNDVYGGMAILARTHRQHEVIVKELRNAEIPYKEIGKETNFWKKSSSRMIISILKVMHNQKNVWHFNRYCRHVIYPMTEAEWYQYEARALRAQKSTLQLLVQEKGGSFAELLAWYQDNRSLSLSSIIEKTLSMVPVQEYFLMQSLTTKAMEVLEIFVHTKDWEDANEENRTVPAFLEWLAAQEVQIEIAEDRNEVKVATIHAVKGLEFPVVFIAGLVEGKLPSNMAVMEGSVEEERRLAYVAVTRAKDRLYLYHYRSKGKYGGTAKPSRFLQEMFEKSDAGNAGTQLRFE
mgnify:CR=1 FL=1